MAAHSSILFFFLFFSTPVFLPGESHGQRSLMGYSPWGCKKSDTEMTLALMHAYGDVQGKGERVAIAA